MASLFGNHDSENCTKSDNISGISMQSEVDSPIIPSHDDQLLSHTPAAAGAAVTHSTPTTFIMPAHQDPQGTVIESNIEVVTMPIDMDFHTDPPEYIPNNEDTIPSENTDQSFSLNFDTSSVDSEKGSIVVDILDTTNIKDDDKGNTPRAINNSRPSLDVATVLSKSISPCLTLVRSPIKPKVCLGVSPDSGTNERNKRKRKRRNEAHITNEGQEEMRRKTRRTGNTGYKGGLRSSDKATADNEMGVAPGNDTIEGVASNEETFESEDRYTMDTSGQDESLGNKKTQIRRKRGMRWGRKRRKKTENGNGYENESSIQDNGSKNMGNNCGNDSLTKERGSKNIAHKQAHDHTPKADKTQTNRWKSNSSRYCPAGDESKPGNRESSRDKGTGSGTKTVSTRTRTSTEGGVGPGKKRSSRKQPQRRTSGSDNDGGSPSRKWRCEFCGLGNNVKNLGYLYGPYSGRDEEKSGEGSGGHLECNGVGNKDRPSNKDNQSIWVHSGCVYWSPGVCLLGDRITGLEDAVNTASKTVCSVCGNKGAVLCCDIRTCRKCYHYPCAVEKDCTFNSEKYTITCAKHKTSEDLATPISSEKANEGLAPSINALKLTTPSL